MDDWLLSAWGALTEPLRWPGEAEKRVFWIYLLGAAALATFVYFAQGRRGGVLRYVFARRVWLHPSARLDYALLFTKALLRALLLAPLTVSALGVAVAVVGALDRAFGPAATPPIGRFAADAIYTVALFLAWDASRWWLHRLLHRVPFLWEFHKVHHSAEVMTPLTVYRSHPVEDVLFSLRGALVTGVVTGVFHHFFRGQVTAWDVLGVNGIMVAFNAFGANLRHSHVWLSYGPAIEHVFISPAQHQIHHSVEPEHYERNYGSCLAIWDWLGGSLHVTRGRLRLQFGLRPEDRNHAPDRLGSALLGPIRACLRRRQSESR
jgi:sterol desaturase/sphingolipid hydroxylase (fatty acid hydroxylase superfamily)